MTTESPPRPRADEDAGDPLVPSPARIDPRLRARRIAVLRQIGRRRLTAAIVVGAVVIVLVLAWAVVFHSPWLSVSKFDVRGASYTDRAAITQAAASVRGDAMLTADLGQVRRQVEALPWVASARVSRQWPRSLRIDVVERTPAAALFQADGTWRVVDLDGRILAASPNQPAGLVPIVAGGAVVAPGATVDGWRAQAIAVAGRLAPALSSRLADVRLHPEGGVALSLRDGGAVWFGNADDLPAKQLEVLAVLESLGDEPVGIIDARVAGAPVLRPATAEQTAEQTPGQPLTSGGG